VYIIGVVVFVVVVCNLLRLRLHGFSCVEKLNNEISSVFLIKQDKIELYLVQLLVKYVILHG